MAAAIRSTELDYGGKEFADRLWSKLIGYGAAPFIEFEQQSCRRRLLRRILVDEI
jgi:hypothetical protein